MPTDVKGRVDAIVHDTTIDRAAKIKKLRQMETDAMARDRATSEGMTAPASRDGDDLKAIEKALTALGEDAADTGAASI
ncbi:MAG: hypothetical protein EOP61_17470 [Sphingomonadales bacterium]|nr:MAG: hypothetical protein EOP61_17470 [Sphingomonadales bacterium]